tara:strand:+ start:74 stop:310 length:237 start_codon:yes stop_codon:yes gene_type:complete
MSKKEETLNELHTLLAQKLLDRVNDPECKSADLNVARQFLKDNNIDAVPVAESPLAKLADKLPFSDKELKSAMDDQFN